ncbi:PAS domain S-box protein [Ferruginibacter sp.]
MPAVKTFHLVLFIVLNQIVCTAGKAQLQQPGSNSYFAQHFGEEEGLPQNSINSILPDRYGFLWIATESGITRFNGNRFLPVHTRKGIINGNFTRIKHFYYKGKDTILAFSAATQQIAYIVNNSITAIKKHQYGDGLFFLNLHETVPQKAFLHADSSMQQWYIAPGGYTGTVYSKDTLLVTLTDGIGVYDSHGLINKIPVNNLVFKKLLYLQGKAAYIDEDNYINFYTAAGLQQRKPLPLPVKQRLSLFNNGDGNDFFCVADSALYNISINAAGEPVVNLLFNNLQNANDITMVYQKDSNTIVVGTQRSGLYVYRKKFFTLTDPMPNGEPDAFYVQQLLPDGHTVLTGGDKLFVDGHFTGKTKTPYATFPYTSLKDSKGYYWYIYKNRVLHGTDIGPNADTILRFKGSPNILFEDRQGRVWFISSHLAGYFANNIFTEVTIANLRLDIVSYMQQREDGVYLIGTREGLFILNSIKDHEVTEVAGLHSFDIRFLHPEADGKVWVCTYGHGFFLMDKDSIIAFPDNDGKLAYVHCIVQDKQGYMWMPTNNGLFVTHRDAVMAYINNRNKLPFYYGFSKKSGLRTNEFNGGCQPVYLQLPGGAVSLASMQGLVQFDPAAIQFTTAASAIMIDNIYVDSTEVLQHNNIEVANNVLNISFAVSSAFWGQGENELLEYQVVEKGKQPSDGQWLQVDASGKINLFSPSFGNYQLVVRKRNGLQTNDYAYQQVDFRVMPKWFQTSWFFIGRAIFFCCLLAGIFLWRRNYYKRSHRILKQKVDAATSQLQQMNSTLEKKVEQRTLDIQEAEKKFRTLVEGSLAGVYIVQDDVFTYVNPRFEEILGYGKDELIGKASLLIISEDQRKMVMEKAIRRMSGEVESEHYEVTGLKKDGSKCALEFFGSITLYEGKPTIIGTMMDVTERKEIENELREAEQKFRDLVEKSLVGVYIIQDGKFAYVNPRFAEIFGQEQQALMDAPSVDIVVYEGDRQLVSDNIRKRIAGDVEGINYFIRGIKKDGTIIYVELFGRITRFDGKPAIIGTLLDITEQKIAQEQLIKEKDLSQSIINSLPGVFYIFDEAGNHLLWNRNFEIITGYNSQQLQQKKTGACVEEKDRAVYQKAVETIYATGKAEMEITLVTSTQQKIPFYVNGIAITYNGKACVLAIGIDISERKKAEQERERANYLLNERVKELTTLYRAGIVLQREERSIIVTLQDFVHIVPQGWQYNSITAARITLGELEFTTPGFTITPYLQEAGFVTSNGTPGKIQVVYLQETPPEVEGPFLAEERELINMLADMLRIHFIRREAVHALQKSEANLNTIFENTDTIYVLLDMSLKIMAFNQRAADLVRKELNRELQLYTDFVDYFPETRHDGMNASIQKVMQGNLVSYEMDYKQADGTVNWYYIRMFPVNDSRKVMFGLMLAASDITEKKLLEQEILNRSIQEQKMITRAILTGEERERNKIGQELHDNVSQILAGTRLYLGMARKNTTSGEAIITESMELIEKAIEEIRSLSKGKVTPMKKVNLQELLQQLIERFNETTGIKTSFIYNGSGQVIEDDLKLNIYRIIQEQLNNILKHSRAKMVNVLVEAGSDNIRVLVTDNGRGFEPTDRMNGIGLSNIANRVESFNGTINIESSPGNGCQIEINLPHSPEEDVV